MLLLSRSIPFRKLSTKAAFLRPMLYAFLPHPTFPKKGSQDSECVYRTLWKINLLLMITYIWWLLFDGVRAPIQHNSTFATIPPHFFACVLCSRLRPHLQLFPNALTWSRIVGLTVANKVELEQNFTCLLPGLT